jgi:hypothetical protein
MLGVWAAGARQGGRVSRHFDALRAFDAASMHYLACRRDLEVVLPTGHAGAIDHHAAALRAADDAVELARIELWAARAETEAQLRADIEQGAA